MDFMLCFALRVNMVNIRKDWVVNEIYTLAIETF